MSWSTTDRCNSTAVGVAGGGPVAGGELAMPVRLVGTALYRMNGDDPDESRVC